MQDGLSSSKFKYRCGCKLYPQPLLPSWEQLQLANFSRRLGSEKSPRRDLSIIGVPGSVHVHYSTQFSENPTGEEFSYPALSGVGARRSRDSRTLAAKQKRNGEGQDCPAASKFPGDGDTKKQNQSGTPRAKTVRRRRGSLETWTGGTSRPHSLELRMRSCT